MSGILIPHIEKLTFRFFTGHAKPSGHEPQRVISYIHVSQKIKTANHAS